jgi:signal transduction histidine kinase
MALTAALVFAGCYASARIMVHLRFTEAGPAILYPPYAILTAVMLLTPVQHWWVYMLTASFASFFPHRLLSPTSYVVLTEIANYTKASMAAGGVRLFRAVRLDTLRAMVAFLFFAVMVGPLCAAFLGAALAVTIHGATDYWLIWRGWFFSNALTGLALLPIIVIVFNDEQLRKPPAAHRIAEAALLAGALLLVGTYVFAMPYAPGGGLSARSYAPLPLLLWAAVRFAVAGTSSSILLVTVLAIWGALEGRGPFVAGTPAENLLQLQLFILAVSLPLMLLAAVVEDRRNKERALRRHEAELQASYVQVQSLVGRLISAQESERTFIGRELHDDICQRLAGLALMVDELKTRLPPDADNLHEEAARTKEATLEIMEAVRGMSHELHPGALRYVGVVAALQDHCNRFANQQGIDVMVQASREIGDVPADLSICIYRVVQEALRNVAVHSGAQRVQVVLRRTDHSLQLTVQDNGRGFEPDNELRSGGLGLISLDERVRLLGGHLAIRSEQQSGTTVTVQLPLPDDVTLRGSSLQ